MWWIPSRSLAIFGHLAEAARLVEAVEGTFGAAGCADFAPDVPEISRKIRARDIQREPHCLIYRACVYITHL